jgi:hypothetical protein
VLEDTLIEIEMKLQHNLTNSISTYEKNLGRITEDMKNRVQGYIGEVQTAVDTFFTEFREKCTTTMDQYAKLMDQNEDELDNDELSNDIVGYLDPDPLKQALDQSREQIDGRISHIETDIQSHLNQDKDAVVVTTKDEQHHRNRNIIREIITMSQKIKNDIEDDFRELRGDDE